MFNAIAQIAGCRLRRFTSANLPDRLRILQRAPGEAKKLWEPGSKGPNPTDAEQPTGLSFRTNHPLTAILKAILPAHLQIPRVQLENHSEYNASYLRVHDLRNYDT